MNRRNKHIQHLRIRIWQAYSIIAAVAIMLTCAVAGLSFLRLSRLYAAKATEYMRLTDDINILRSAYDKDAKDCWKLACSYRPTSDNDGIVIYELSKRAAYLDHKVDELASQVERIEYLKFTYLYHSRYPWIPVPPYIKELSLRATGEAVPSQGITGEP
jgi:hypothetical protein